MKLISISESDIIFPEWIKWITSDNEVIIKGDSITWLCDKTWISIKLILDWNNNIIDLNCGLKGANWKCVSPNWPRNGEWNLTTCNIKIT